MATNSTNVEPSALSSVAGVFNAQSDAILRAAGKWVDSSQRLAGELGSSSAHASGVSVVNATSDAISSLEKSLTSIAGALTKASGNYSDAETKSAG